MGVGAFSILPPAPHSLSFYFLYFSPVVLGLNLRSHTGQMCVLDFHFKLTHFQVFPTPGVFAKVLPLRSWRAWVVASPG